MDSSFFEDLGARGWAGEVAWLRELAASLVRDPDEAEDLAGEVWVQALERRPKVSGDRPLRAWLTVVGRRLASRKRREANSRREREERAARPEKTAGADGPIRRVELQRKLVEAVLALAEPYRSAVVLRHLEQLSIPDIARRQGCTNEAARQRIARGLQQLRARLDREFDGGRDGWMAVFIPFTAHAPVVGTAGVAGAILVSSKTLCAAVICLAAALLWWLWPSLSRTQIDRSSVIAGGALQEFDSQSGHAFGLQAPLAAGSRDAAGPLIGPSQLAGKVVDSSGAPLARVSVSFDSEDELTSPSVETDDAGRFKCDLASEPARDAQFEAFAESAEHCQTSAILRAGEEALIVMKLLPRIEVRVVGPDGQPPEGAGTVKLVVKNTSGASRTTSLILNEDGIARSDPLPPWRLTYVQSSFDGFPMHALTRDDELVGDETLRVDVALVPGVTLRGTVFDERTRRPLSGAIVRAEPCYPLTWADAPSATTDGSGRFELRAVTATRHTLAEDSSPLELYLVTVEIDDFLLLRHRAVAWKHPPAAPMPAIVDNIELLLVPTGSLTVRLHWPDGRDVGTQGALQVLDPDGNLFGSSLNAGGECGLSNVPAGELHVIARTLNPRGLARAQLSLRAREAKTVDLTLQAPDSAVEGSVVDAQGRGVPDALMSVSSFIEQSGKRIGLDWLETRTDAQGHFQLEALYAGSCRVEVENEDDVMPMSSWPPHRTLVLKEGSLATGIEFRAERAVPLSGSLASTTAIDASRPLLLDLNHAEFGTIETTLVTEDGRFEFVAMPGASYVLIARQGTKELGRLVVPQAGYRGLIVPIGP